MTAGATPALQSPATIALIEREKVRLAYGTRVQYVDGRIFSVLLTLVMCGAVPGLNGSASPWIGALWLGADVVW